MNNPIKALFQRIKTRLHLSLFGYVKVEPKNEPQASWSIAGDIETAEGAASFWKGVTSRQDIPDEPMSEEEAFWKANGEKLWELKVAATKRIYEETKGENEPEWEELFNYQKMKMIWAIEATYNTRLDRSYNKDFEIETPKGEAGINNSR